MRRSIPLVALLAALLAGCTVTPADPATPTVAPAASQSAASPSPSLGTPSPGWAPSASPSTGFGSPSGLISPTSSFTPTVSPSSSDSPLESPADSLQAAFAQPENGGIASFLSKHRDYLPVVIGAELVSGASTGPVELSLKNIPAGTTRVYMTIACTASRPYKMELSRADGSVVATSWGDSCGYWGGLNGYTTSPFDASLPPATLKINVDADTRFSYVLYASPGR